MKALCTCVSLASFYFVASIKKFTRNEKYKVISIRIWNLKSERQETILRGHSDGVCSMAITSDNIYLVSGSSDTTIRVWNLREKSQESVLTGHNGSVIYIRITSNDLYIVSSSVDNTSRIWNLSERMQVAVIETPCCYTYSNALVI